MGKGANASDPRFTANHITKPMLFNLATDPDERTNLFAKYPQKAAELRKRLDSHQKRRSPMNRAASWKRFGWLLGMWFCAASRVGASLYYVNPALGNDGNSGTGANVPLKTLAQVNQLSLHAGDAVLLAAGQIFEGQLALENATGTATNPILISSYPQNTKGTDGRALIDAKGFGAGVCLKNCAFIEVANLKITANGGGTRPGQRVKPGQRFGVLIVASQPGEFAGFTLTNVAIKDVFYEAPGFVRSPDDTKTRQRHSKLRLGHQISNHGSCGADAGHQGREL